MLGDMLLLFLHWELVLYVFAPFCLPGLIR
jgi:hypothetical protein